MERCTPSAVAMASTLSAPGASASTSRICTPRLRVCEGGLLGTAGAVMGPLRCTAAGFRASWGLRRVLQWLFWLGESIVDFSATGALPDGSTTHFRCPAPRVRHTSALLARHMRAVYDPHQ